MYVDGSIASLVGTGPGTIFYINHTDTRLYAGVPSDTLPIVLPPHAVLAFPGASSGTCGTMGPVLFTRSSSIASSPACEVSNGFSFSDGFLVAGITGTFLVCGDSQQVRILGSTKVQIAHRCADRIYETASSGGFVGLFCRRTGEAANRQRALRGLDGARFAHNDLLPQFAKMSPDPAHSLVLFMFVTDSFSRCPLDIQRPVTLVPETRCVPLSRS